MSGSAILTVHERQGRIYVVLPERHRADLFVDFRRYFTRYRWARGWPSSPVVNVPLDYKERLREWLDKMSGQFEGLHVVDEDGVLALAVEERTCSSI